MVKDTINKVIDFAKYVIDKPNSWLMIILCFVMVAFWYSFDRHVAKLLTEIEQHLDTKVQLDHEFHKTFERRTDLMEKFVDGKLKNN